ncbi:MAG TPA: hypothetical protein VGS22_25295 [Thermoanaerobaculia bacterium]|jgi:hypothetical protein|nr:hypothetical protein [Thermoanaerobaculia bacterium]
MDGTDNPPLPPPGTFWRIGATDDSFNAQFRCPSGPVARRYALRIRGMAESMGCPVAVSARGRLVRVELQTHLRSLVFLTTVVLGHEITLAEVLEAP